MKHKKYHLPTTYRGYQVFITCCATSYKEAAKKFDTSLHFVRNYAGYTDEPDYFEGVRGYIDSGYIIYEYNRKDLWNKEMAYDDLKEIIDEYVQDKYNKLHNKLGV